MAIWGRRERDECPLWAPKLKVAEGESAVLRALLLVGRPGGAGSASPPSLKKPPRKIKSTHAHKLFLCWGPVRKDGKATRRGEDRPPEKSSIGLRALGTSCSSGLGRVAGGSGPGRLSGETRSAACLRLHYAFVFCRVASSGKLEKAEILEMTVQYLRALHSADFPRGREKAELLSEFANYFHYGYHECMKNLVHYLTTVERMETKDTKYARILAFLQSKARFVTEPLFTSLGSLPEPDFSYQLHPGPECSGHGHSPAEAVLQPPSGGAIPLARHCRSPSLPYHLPSAAVPLASPGQQRSTFLSSVQGLDRHYLNLLGHSHPNAFGLPPGQHPSML
ncbi:LOW QUALITY PROTEIN: hairy and enhancer of split-related protein HELT [Manacus vitellinus]|uniref:LOW QUALITY PROTEIN: hairy and enhancer of split-related protein HELT n=1 Tax=Manacus vitellinus TaxID=328815 RepID=UPI00115EF7E3|nr:LOW QUALITY PROTEIN: hairy and enhancer of split-related protein HELT [Manacus vitellinus]